MVDGKPRMPMFLTINRELALLRSLLNLAEEDEVIDAAPRFTSKNGKNALIKSERDHARKRVCSADELGRCVKACHVPRLRVIDGR